MNPALVEAVISMAHVAPKMAFQALLGDIQGNVQHRMGLRFFFKNIKKRKIEITEDNLGKMAFNLFQQI